jgi:seryl-tRNA(Sec) selenium transferase
VPVLDDLGSGALADPTVWGLPPEPVVLGSCGGLGADLVSFSGTSCSAARKPGSSSVGAR